MFRFAAIAMLAYFCAFPSVTYAGTLYFDPDTETHGLGDTFILNVRLNNDNECINAVHAEISYPKESLRAVDFSRGGSILSLWVGEPAIDTARGTVSFSGGVPGGYCGRIQGDPALSNIVGKIVFTVIDAREKSAVIRLTPASLLYLNDGMGTKAETKVRDAKISIVEEPQGSGNPWLAAVEADTIPPEAFTIQVESTRGVLGGKYFAVFSTLDKQSGLDHYEIFERGAWNIVTSPHELLNQSLKGGIQLKAIDKAGNERLGNYAEGSAPPRQYSLSDFTFPLFVVLFFLVVAVVKIVTRVRKRDENVVDLRT